MISNSILRRALRAIAIAAVAMVTMTFAAPSMEAQQSSVVVRDAWVREAAAGRAVTGAFMILENKSSTARSLVRGTASVGDTLELHEMKRTDGMMSMAPVQRIEVPANGETALRPGGYHLMLFGLKKPLVANDTIQLILTFDDGSTTQVAATVRSMQGRMP